MTHRKTLILGGVRFGKRRLAERLATDSGLPVTVIATATPSAAASVAGALSLRMSRQIALACGRFPGSGDRA